MDLEIFKNIHRFIKIQFILYQKNLAAIQKMNHIPDIKRKLFINLRFLK